MQTIPLLEKIDWFFTSVSWTSDHPNTVVMPLARTASDHVPCVVTVATSILKDQVIRFENSCVNLPGFLDCVTNIWNKPTRKCSATSSISAKFKALHYALKRWHVSLSKVKTLIIYCNKVILHFDGLEELRALTWPKLNFRKIVKLHLEEILRLQFIYWKQQCTI